MRIAIHQPEHIPWLGFFHKMMAVELFIFLDNVQFEKNYFQNRNKIRTSQGWTWVTVPVCFTSKTKINDVMLLNDRKWKSKWCNSIFFSYKKSIHFERYYLQFSKVINHQYNNLSELNIALIHTICEFLNINPRFIKASELDINGKGSELIVSLCHEVKADSYLSGISGKNYLKIDDFRKKNIEVTFQEFHHPIYRQFYNPFLPCMSTIDLLFNYGDRSKDIINGKNVTVMDKIFL